MGRYANNRFARRTRSMPRVRKLAVRCRFAVSPMMTNVRLLRHTYKSLYPTTISQSNNLRQEKCSQRSDKYPRQGDCRSHPLADRVTNDSSWPTAALQMLETTVFNESGEVIQSISRDRQRRGDSGRSTSTNAQPRALIPSINRIRTLIFVTNDFVVLIPGQQPTNHYHR